MSVTSARLMVSSPLDSLATSWSSITTLVPSLTMPPIVCNTVKMLSSMTSYNTVNATLYLWFSLPYLWISPKLHLVMHDLDFAAACERATNQAIHTYQEEEYALLCKNLTTTPYCYHGLPFHQYIAKYAPLNTIKTDAKHLLWHQCLGHPSDYYLFHIHQHMKGIPGSLTCMPSLTNVPHAMHPGQANQRTRWQEYYLHCIRPLSQSVNQFLLLWYQV